MRKRVWLALLLFHSALGIRHSALGQAPALIHYQGRLLDGTNLYNGPASLVFSFYVNTNDVFAQQTATAQVQVVDGLYSTVIGAPFTGGLAPSFDDALYHTQLWMSVSVNGVGLSPFERVLSVPYARMVHGLRVMTNHTVILAPRAGGHTVHPSSAYGVIGGGQWNLIDASAGWSVVDGGFSNRVLESASFSVLGGGRQNLIQGNASQSVLGGGSFNTIQTNATTAVLAGGNGNVIQTNARFAVLGGGLVNRIGADAYQATIPGGWNNRIEARATNAVIAGGEGNQISTNAAQAAIGGGARNVIGTNSTHAVIGGGLENAIGEGSDSATIAGGQYNYVLAGSGSSSVGGGSFNIVEGSSPYGRIGGGAGNVIRPLAAASAIGGGWINVIGPTSEYAVIGGGYQNVISNASPYAVIAGGEENHVSRNAGRAVIGGGRQNYIDSTTPYAVIGGGLNNRALNLALYSTIGGGWDNLIGVDSESALVAGGRDNQIQESAGAAILGGQHHRIWPFAYQAVIAGGLSNQAAGPQSFAAGTRARALHGGSFVWGDSSTGTVDSTAVNQTTFRASSGGFRVFTSAAATSGVTLAANAGSWTSISDVNAKEAFAPVDTRAVLDQVAALPITTWRYKGQAEEIRHIGPTAQDFHAAFRVGDAPGYGITAVDADGVALAAIQALAEEDRRQRTEDGGRQDQINALKRENAELMKRLDRLERELQGIRQERDH